MVSLGSLLVIIGLMIGFLWGHKAGFFESLLRLVGFAAASCLTLCGLRPVASILNESAFDGDWFWSYGVSWVALFAVSSVAFWVLGNCFLIRGRLAFYQTLDKTLGVACALVTILLLSSAFFIGLRLIPVTHKVSNNLLPPGKAPLLKADDKVPRLFSLMTPSGEVPFSPDRFMEAVNQISQAEPPVKPPEPTPVGDAPPADPKTPDEMRRSLQHQ